MNFIWEWDDFCLNPLPRLYGRLTNYFTFSLRSVSVSHQAWVFCFKRWQFASCFNGRRNGLCKWLNIFVCLSFDLPSFLDYLKIKLKTFYFYPQAALSAICFYLYIIYVLASMIFSLTCVKLNILLDNILRAGLYHIPASQLRSLSRHQALSSSHDDSRWGQHFLGRGK